MSSNNLEKILSILNSLPLQHEEALKPLFWEELNYDKENVFISIREWPEKLKELIESPPTIFASAGDGNEFHVIVSHLKTLKMNSGAERQLVNQLINEHHYALFIFSNFSQEHWHFVNVVYENLEKTQRRRILRRISISPEDRLRTACERIAKLNIADMHTEGTTLTPIQIQHFHEEAFDVEAVTKEFFNKYKEIFRSIESELLKQSKDQVWSRGYGLQFLNRLMFLYYIQRKKWLGNNSDFLHHFWRTYRNSGRPKDTFVNEWLHVLFFEAFNEKFQAGRADLAYLPVDIRNVLQLAPYLNGGLFRKNNLDDLAAGYSINIDDQVIKQVFDFLDQYNFTISEDTPLDQEVAVDPEMIGKVYETLVNVSSQAVDQADIGIFYTQRIEIDLMCRLSLVDWLTNHIGQEHKSALYEAVFAYEPEDKVSADEELSRRNLWPDVDLLLSQVAILDPACGSGSFLVGMLIILDDLISRCSNQLGRQETYFERRRRIIGNSLYGVDIMGWAVDVAELRLWLQLVIETELEGYELKAKALLPNLTFKIRRGDSLVQEIGGINFSLQRVGGYLSSSMKGKITRLKGEKLKFYNNDPTCRYHNENEIRHDEFLIFKELLDERQNIIKKRINELDQAFMPQTNLLGELQNPQMTLDLARKQQELEDLRNQLTQLETARKAFYFEHEIPFIWDISFVEIFEGDMAGFDIVIGNPPYVRQEKIHDPSLLSHEFTTENKKAYKDKLARSVYSAWQKSFSLNINTGRVGWNLDKKSDYYIYFYFDCLKLLNPNGSFCFITSNSWLDVGYGSDLQQFLLTRGKIKIILDNQVKRSFAHADVNTVIVLLGAAEDSKNDLSSSLEHAARFVMFKVPFENGLSPVIWEEVEDVEDRRSTEEYRCVVKKQQMLLESGMDTEAGVYDGDKWGGKYLRAPDIYWVILEKAKDKLVRLGDIADVRRGITSGANEFFYLDDEKIKKWGIEEEYLMPVLLSSKEIEGYYVKRTNCRNMIFLCHEDKKLLIKKNALKYIKWGESQGFNSRPSCRSRLKWYNLGDKPNDDFIMLRFRDQRNWTPLITGTDFIIGDTFFVGRFQEERNSILGGILLNSTIQILITEIFGRINLGEGLLTTYGPDIKQFPILDPSYFIDEEENINKIFKKIQSRNVLTIFEEILSHDRKEFDIFIFELLGLSQSCLSDLYEAVYKLVNKRVEKATN